MLKVADEEIEYFRSLVKAHAFEKLGSWKSRKGCHRWKGNLGCSCPSGSDAESTLIRQSMLAYGERKWESTARTMELQNELRKAREEIARLE